MGDISKLNVGGTLYDIKDAKARTDVSDLKEDINAISAFKGLSWTLKKTISETGEIQDTNMQALTNIVACSEGDIIIGNDAEKDNNNNYFTANVSLYRLQGQEYVFVSRESFGFGGQTKVIPSNVDGFRLNFGRLYASGITITESDISTYTHYEVYQKGVTVGEYLSTKFKLEDFISRYTENGSMGAMVDIAETYFNQAYSADNQIIYQTTLGIYTDPVNDQNIKATVCSQLSESIINAIPYEYSRYEQANNEPLWWGYIFDSSTDATFTGTRGYLLSDQQAKYCDDKGWLVPFDVSHNNMKPGDLVFWQTEGRDDKYLSITHVGICLYTTSSGAYYIHAGGNSSRPIDQKDVGISVTYFSWSGYAPSHYATLPIIPSEYKTTLIRESTEEFTGSYSGYSGYVESFYFNSDPLPIGFYTLIWNDKGNGATPYVKYNSSGVNINIDCHKSGSKCYAVFYATEPITQLDLRSSGGTTFDVDYFALYKGYKTF